MPSSPAPSPALPATANPKLNEPPDQKTLSNYISYKYGNVRSNYLMPYAKYKSDNGITNDFEFFWGSLKFAKLIGGVNLDSNNHTNGFALGLVFGNQDVVYVRTFKTDDELLKENLWTGFTESFGRVKSKTTEYTYVWNVSPSTYMSWNYGKSSYPAGINANKKVIGTDDFTFIDPRPQFEYFFFGVEFDPIRASLLSGKPISDQAFGGETMYVEMRWGLGLLATELSGIQYSTINENSSNQFGLNYQEGLDLYTPMYIELGAHHSVNNSYWNAIGTIGVYGQSPNAITEFFKLNESSTGYYWVARSPFQFGFLARLGVSF
jgi:hypothetical protein